MGGNLGWKWGNDCEGVWNGYSCGFVWFVTFIGYGNGFVLISDHCDLGIP